MELGGDLLKNLYISPEIEIIIIKFGIDISSSPNAEVPVVDVIETEIDDFDDI